MSPVLTPDKGIILNRDRHGNSGPSSSGRKAPPMQILLLVVVGLLVVMGGFRLIVSANSRPAEEMLRVVAAGEDLPPGCRLGFANMHYMSIPKQYFNPQMFTSYEQLAGSTSKFFLRRGEPISRTDMLPLKQTLSGVIDPAVRAVSLKLDPDALVDYAIHPGDRVDVLVTVAKDSKRYTRTVAQNVTVLFSTPKEMMLSDKFRGSENSKVTLALTPEDCERVTEAVESGRVRLALRNQADTRQHALKGASELDVLPWDALKPAAKSVAPALAVPRMAPPPPPPMTGFQPPPMVPVDQGQNLDPVKWVVEMFAGSKKESCEVPDR